jgi:hypothetical protein
MHNSEFKRILLQKSTMRRQHSDNLGFALTSLKTNISKRETASFLLFLQETSSQHFYTRLLSFGASVTPPEQEDFQC